MYFKTRKAVGSGKKKLTDLNVEELETLVQVVEFYISPLLIL